MAMLVHSAADGSTNTPGLIAMGGGDKGSVPDRGREGMTRMGGHRAMQRAGTTGAEIA
jgi:hypothetical protein